MSRRRSLFLFIKTGIIIIIALPTLICRKKDKTKHDYCTNNINTIVCTSGYLMPMIVLSPFDIKINTRLLGVHPRDTLRRRSPNPCPILSLCILSVSAFDQVQKLKNENNLLTSKVKELEDRLFALKRSGCGSACGRHGGNLTSGELESSSASSSSAESQHSVSPSARARADGAGETDSVHKTYNLRRRAKTVDGAAAESDAAGDSVALTRGRRTGLRDMTNAVR